MCGTKFKRANSTVDKKTKMAGFENLPCFFLDYKGDGKVDNVPDKGCNDEADDCQVLYSTHDNPPLTEDLNKDINAVCDDEVLQDIQFRSIYNQLALQDALKRIGICKHDVQNVCQQLNEAPLDKSDINRLQKMVKETIRSAYNQRVLRTALDGYYHLDETAIQKVFKVLDESLLTKNKRRQLRQMLAKLPASTSKKGKQHALCCSSPMLSSTTSIQVPEEQQTPLNLYSNWDQFNRKALNFFESQRALLFLCTKNLPVTKINGVLELDLIRQRLTDGILQNVKKLAAQLEGVNNKILSQRLALQTEEIRLLQEKIEQLKQKDTELSFSMNVTDQNELADRLDAQTVCLKEKDRKISELQDRLNSQKKYIQDDLNCDRVKKDVSDEMGFCELGEKEVAKLEPRALIGYIRHELGVGTENLSPAQRRIFRSMRGKLGAALEKLAHDIYSNDSQIVLEIIQNADDNFYGRAEPRLSITVRTDKYMWVMNNEVGFTNENVVAISNIGASTKKDISRFTGHKGIGFKSVFKVTRTPYIISKDFCFRFNLDSEHTEENVGYILPEWVEKNEVAAIVSPEKIDPKMTHFFFPFTPSVHFPAEELYDGIDFIPLFLRQLQTIELVVDNKRKVVTVRKVPHKDSSGVLETFWLTVVEHTTSLTSVEVSQKTHREVEYRVYRKTFDVPQDLQNSQVGRAPPTKTELILAFPVLSDSPGDLESVEIQKVYSYLPVETAGFRFIVQGDFNLVSSRDRVHSQDLFNRWLSWMIPVAFQEAFGLSEDPGKRSNSLCEELLTFLPTKEELARLGQSESSTDGFWRRVMKGIRDRVMDSPCVLTETGRWAKPNEVYIRPQGHEDLFTNDELQSTLNKEFVCRKMATEAAYGLGCKHLTPVEALTILNHPDFIASKREPNWFCKLYRFFGSHVHGVSELLDSIFKIKMFPLNSGNVSSLEEGRIFLWRSTPIFGIGERVLRLLALDLTALAQSDLVHQFLETVGICAATPQDVANSILVYHGSLPRPVSASPAFTDLITKDQLWEQLKFLKDNWKDVLQVFPSSEAVLLVPVQPPQVTVHNLTSEDQTSTQDSSLCYYHLAKFVYMPSLRGTFKEIGPALSDSVVFLDDSYVYGVGQSALEEWNHFLMVKLGVNQALRLCETYNGLFQPSDELKFALKLVIDDAIRGSPTSWNLLLRHFQTNWKYLKKSDSLIQSIRMAPSGYGGFSISSVFPALQQYKDMLLDSNGQPCIDLPAFEGITNEGMLTDLGIDTCITMNGLLKLERFLKCPGLLDKEPVLDLNIWKKVYAMMKKIDVRPVELLVRGPTNESGTFVKCNHICVDVPSSILVWTDLVQFREDDYAGVPDIKSWFRTLEMHDLTKALWAMFNKKLPANEKDLEESLMECFRRIDALLAVKSKQANIPLVLDRNCRLRMSKYAHQLVMPDQLDLYQKFLTSPRCFCPIMFVHPQLAKLEHLAKTIVSSVRVPLLSQIITICPVATSWNGYHVFPPGTTNVDIPTFLCSSLTNLYRAVLAEFLFHSSSTLKQEDKVNLGNLMRAAVVYVCAIECPQVPVAYTVHGISRAVLEDYFIRTSTDGQKQIIVPSYTLSRPLEEQVDFSALKDLFPALAMDEHMKTLIQQMISGDLKHRLDSQHILSFSDEQKTFNFEIIVEASEAVQKANENRKSFCSSLMPHQKKYTIRNNASHCWDTRCIPGLTYQKPAIPPPPSPRSHSLPFDTTRNSVEKVSSRAHLPMKRQLSPASQNDGRFGVGDSRRMPCPSMLESPNDAVPVEPCKRAKFGSAPPASEEFRKQPAHNDFWPPLQAKVEVVNRGQDCDKSSGSASPGRLAFAQRLCPPANLMPKPPLSAPLPQMMTRDDNASAAASSENDNSYSLQRMKSEILSWSQRSFSEIESRLLGNGKLKYNFFVHSGSAANSALWQNLRRLEGEDEFSKSIGLWAEKIAFSHLLDLCKTRRPLLQGAKYVSHPPETFTSENWVSSARQHFENQPCSCDDSKGYDFCYRQTNGLMVYVEVKGHTTFANSFLLSSNEWEVAQRIANNRNEVYVILGINLNAVSMAGAQITYLLENPIELAECGMIIHRPFNYLVEVVSPVAPPTLREQESSFVDSCNNPPATFAGPNSQWSVSDPPYQRKRPFPGQRRMTRPKRGRFFDQNNGYGWF